MTSETPGNPDDLTHRLSEVAGRWNVLIEQIVAGSNAVLAYGTQAGDTVVLKVVHHTSNEALSGAVASMFGTNGMVPILMHEPGAVLMARQVPGTQLASMLSIDQLEAMDDILADVFRRVHYRRRRMSGLPTVLEWGQSFPQYLDSGKAEVPRPAAERAWRVYEMLCQTQGRVTVLHGDLHHHNVLLDDEEGWKAIDPKGIIGEREFELGITLRNPLGYPHLYTQSILAARARRFESTCRTSAERILAWAGVLGVLSALWSLEDGEQLSDGDPAVLVATALGLWEA